MQLQTEAVTAAVPGRRARTADTAILLLFSATLFVSSSLLFTIQPMVGKMLLPLLGGTPAVWNTCMLFFQAALLAGYAYAHGSCRWLGLRRQTGVHVVVLLLPLLALPIAVAAGGAPPDDRTPVLWLLWQLTLAVGAPFVVVSTTAPLLQRWFAGTGHPQAQDPYFLYAASNTGSLLALLAYPVLLEPALRLTQQTWAWAGVYGLFVVLVLSCAVVVRRARTTALETQPADGRDAHPTLREGHPTVARRLWWIFLAFVPSSLMLGVTTYLTTDIAAVPLLWVLPLALYLLTFVIAFSRRPLLSSRLTGRILPLVLLPLTFIMMLNLAQSRWTLVGLHIAVFFIAALTCHGRLAASRPSTHYLTEYYFWMSVGGVLGGIFNALVAPVLFATVFEYPLALALACFAVPGDGPNRNAPVRAGLDFLLPLVGGALWAGYIATWMGTSGLGTLLLIVVPPLAVLSFYRRPVRLGLGAAVLVAGQAYLTYFRPSPPLCLERNFFGVKRVVMEPGGVARVLVHGGTVHGRQYTDPARSNEPLTYYHRAGPAGDLFRALNERRPQAHVAAIGLGAGSVACYAQPQQHFTFYELDPAMARIAQDPRYFTFLQQCAGRCDVVLGDGRLTLGRSPDGEYDLILLDAFNSDSIPTHLLTREALQLYLRKLAPAGWIAFHYTNRALDIAPVLANLAAEAGLTCIYRDDRVAGDDKAPAKYAALARRPEDLAALAAAPGWQPLPPQPGLPVWTDQYSNLLGLLKWR